MNKRYSEFDTLDKLIKDNYPNLPSLPAKTFFKLSDSKYIEERQKVLNTYIKVSFYTNFDVSNFTIFFIGIDKP